MFYLSMTSCVLGYQVFGDLYRCDFIPFSSSMSCFEMTSCSVLLTVPIYIYVESISSPRIMIYVYEVYIDIYIF